MEEETLPRYSMKVHLLVVASIVALVGIGIFAYVIGSRAPEVAIDVDLQQYYPNDTAIETQYLEGANTLNGEKSRSVLWYKATESNSGINYLMYNSAPDDPLYRTCHWDELSWDTRSDKKSSSDDELVYSHTHSDCDVSLENPSTDIVYEPAIVFLPRTWNTGDSWKHEGKVDATYSENGVVRCVGTNTYTAEIVDYKVTNAAKGFHEIHWRTSQFSQWTSGPGSSFSGCGPGQSSHWQEDYYLTNDIEQANGTATKGLRRTLGGNRDVNYPNWNITFSEWTKLPE